jgi:hypothetical protein
VSIIKTPVDGYPVLKSWVAAYMRHTYGGLAWLAPLAVLGAVMLWRERRPAIDRAGLALLVGAILYCTTLAVTFNTIEDRYRLPSMDS